jgi:SAM-dependent methyltransferase
MGVNYWDNSYESGRVPWDPGEYDGHLPYILDRFDIRPGRALDIGCGTGKSLLWLAERGFDCTGLELAPAALRIAQAAARRRGLRCRWLLAKFPDGFATEATGAERYDFVMDRGWFHLYTGISERRNIARAVSRVLVPGGHWYSLIAARIRGGGFGGPPRWSEEEIRKAVEPELDVAEIELSVFTPGEEGSMPSWRAVFARRNGRSGA